MQVLGVRVVGALGLGGPGRVVISNRSVGVPWGDGRGWKLCRVGEMYIRRVNR